MKENELGKLQQFYPKILIGVATTVALVLMIYLGSLVFQALTPPNVVAISPKDQSTGVSPFISVSFTFDRSLSQDNRNHITVSPTLPSNISIVNGTLILSSIPALPLGQKITVTFTNPTSTTGKVGKTVSISFTTKSKDELNSAELHQAQFAADQQLGQQIQQASQTLEFQKANAINSLIQSCPYETSDFLVQYIQPRDLFQVTIKQNPYATRKQQATDWLKSIGITDLSWINLEFTSAPGVVPQ